MQPSAHIPLDLRRFLQWLSLKGRTQHESGSASFGIKPRLAPFGSLRGDMAQESDSVVKRPASLTCREYQSTSPEAQRKFDKWLEANAVLSLIVALLNA